MPTVDMTRINPPEECYKHTPHTCCSDKPCPHKCTCPPDTIDTLVRDLTTVHPKTKAEVRRRLKAFREEVIEECIAQTEAQEVVMFVEAHDVTRRVKTLKKGDV